MATDGFSSFVLYYYADDGIQWTTGDASGGSGGLGGTPAQVGFNAGDGVRFASVPGSRTSEIINITQTSNVDVPGVWIFQVDEDIKPAGCGINDAGEYASMYFLLAYIHPDVQLYLHMYACIRISFTEAFHCHFCNMVYGMTFILL